MYVGMERKLENGSEVQNTAYRWSGTMMRLRIVKSERNKTEKEYNEDTLPHGT